MRVTQEGKESNIDSENNFQFDDIFKIEEIQRLQDLFSDATGVASIITYPDGTPITNPSNFCSLCNNIVRNTEKGRANCYLSDAMLGKPNPLGPVVKSCLSCGLLDAGTSIVVGGKHIANWLIGQVRNEGLDEQRIMQYADEIGANKEDFEKAFSEVPFMSLVQFNKLAEMLFVFANELSEKAYINLQLKMQILGREKAISLLQESEENMRYIVRYDPNAIAVYDCELRYIAVSERYLQDYDVKEEDIIGKHHYEVFPEMPQKWKDVHQRCLAGAIESNDDDSFERPDGSITYNRWECRPWRRVNGEIGGIITYTEVTTKRKLVENEITILAHALKSVNECVSITDLDNKILFVNESFLKTYGYLRNEIIGENISVVRSQFNEQKQVAEILTATISGEWKGELLNKRKDGSEFPVFLSTSIVKDKENKVLGLIGVATDITEHKHAEETLLKLSSAFEQTVDTLVITDLNGNIEYVNQAFEDTTGYSSEEALGKTPRIIKSGRLSQQYYEDMWRTILSGKVFRSEILNKKKNGELYYVEKTISPIFDKNRTITNFVGTGVDITKRKHVEKELIEAKERAEESDRLKTSFLNNISHEIRTPFNGLLGFLSLIQDEELPTSERDEYINIINKSAYRLMNTINDIVEISQIQAGQITLTSSKTEIRRLISEIYSRFKPDAESNGLKFFLNNNLPNNIESIYTDSLKLNTILSHLIGNAIKFTKEGSIQFEIRLVDQGNEFGRDKACIVSTPSKLQFSVKDTGVGIAKSKIQAIFEKFMQADGSNNRQFEGSGLGLSIAKAYVEMLGGKIWVESEEGIGSTFYFSIPYITDTKVKQDMANLSSYREDKTQLDISKVLIAEDDETSASFIKEIVSKFTKEVFIAKNGIEAVNLCQKNPDLDLILMDIQMPELNGYKATQQIREFNKDVIIIAQTAFALSGDKEKSLDAGCNDYITKPINQDQLIALIKKYFDQK